MFMRSLFPSAFAAANSPAAASPPVSARPLEPAQAFAKFHQAEEQEKQQAQEELELGQTIENKWAEVKRTMNEFADAKAQNQLDRLKRVRPKAVELVDEFDHLLSEGRQFLGLKHIWLPAQQDADKWQLELDELRPLLSLYHSSCRIVLELVKRAEDTSDLPEVEDRLAIIEQLKERLNSPGDDPRMLELRKDFDTHLRPHLDPESPYLRERGTLPLAARAEQLRQRAQREQDEQRERRKAAEERARIEADLLEQARADDVESARLEAERAAAVAAAAAMAERRTRIEATMVAEAEAADAALARMDAARTRLEAEMVAQAEEDDARDAKWEEERKAAEQALIAQAEAAAAAAAKQKADAEARMSAREKAKAKKAKEAREDAKHSAKLRKLSRQQGKR